MLKTKRAGWPRSWRENTWLSQLLQPLAWGYAGWVKQRQASAKPQPSARPIVVVGNIVVGGTGKTLMLCWLIEQCLRLGIKVGVVSRGYGGSFVDPQPVHLGSSAEQVGDEPLMLRQLGVPVVVAKRRILAVERLLHDHPELDFILSDDGLQHYELPRDLELCLFAGEPALGNARMLPAGPLREPLSRLDQVDWVICKSSIPKVLEPWQPMLMTLQAMPLKALPNSLANPDMPPQMTDLVVAYCGIGQPESFFSLLQAQGWQFEPMALPDHGFLDHQQRQSLLGRTVLMTTKDAIKLRHETLLFDAWEVPVRAAFSPADTARFMPTLLNLLSPSVAARVRSKDDQHDPRHA